jgi:general secretion pathway protein J
MILNQLPVTGYEVKKNRFYPSRVRPASSGFTLIEVLIALTLLSIMVVLLFTTLKICADSWEKGENKINDVNQIAVVYNFFQHHLATAKPLSTTTAIGEKTLSFQGQTESLQFVSSFPASAGKFGLQLFTINLLEDDNDQYIYVTLVPFATLSEDEEPAKKEEVTLISHVSSFKLSYFGSDDIVSEGAWADEWVNKEAMPKLVKINITLANGMFWPEMIFDLKVTGIPENNGPAPNIIDNSQDNIDNTQNMTEPEAVE